MIVPNILSCSRSDSEIELSFQVEESLAYFRGHFPGAPVFPGVVQIGWAIELGTEYFNIKKNFKSLDVIKFLKVILPDTRLTLRLRYQPDKGSLTFSYQTGDTRVSSGRITFSNNP